MSNQNKDQFVTSLRGVRISLISLLLFAASVGLGEVGSRITGSEFLRWFMPYFGVGFSAWTYAFFFNRRYRFTRAKRLVLFIGLSAIGFGLIQFLFLQQESAFVRLGIVIWFLLPPIAEFILNRPILRRTPP